MPQNLEPRSHAEPRRATQGPAYTARQGLCDDADSDAYCVVGLECTQMYQRVLLATALVCLVQCIVQTGQVAMKCA